MSATADNAPPSFKHTHTVSLKTLRHLVFIASVFIGVCMYLVADMRATLQWLALGSAVVSAAALTPEELIAAPRRGEALPNPAGEIALFETSQYSFRNHSSTKWWSLMDLDTGSVSVLTEDSNIAEMTWLGSTPSAVLYINSTNAEIPGGVELWIAETSDFINSRYKAASLPSSFSGLKTAVAESGDIHFLVHGQSHSNGTPYNEKLVTTSLSSARIYDSIYVRHWDTWLTPTFNAVFSGTLRKTNIKERASIYYHMREPLNNLVAGVKNLESPSPPFGGSSDYDISPNGKLVAFKSKAPELPRANHTASYIYLASHDGSHDPVAINGPHSAYTPAGIRGDSSGPAFSPDSRQLAYFQMEDIFYESDRRTLYVYTIGSQEIIPSVAKNWDRSPDTVKWTRDGQSLIVGCEDKARSRLFHIPASAPDSFVPHRLTENEWVSAYYMLPDGDMLVTGSTIWNSWMVFRTNHESVSPNMLFLANEVDPALQGLSAADVDEFYFEGSWTDIHSWVVYPADFDRTRSYPLLLFVHGGPQGSWGNSWSTRWNYKVFADQGYVVVAPNPTGSSGFGEELTDMIQNNWGGYPYEDLEKCWEYVRDNFEFVDTEHGVAVGASFGGFMINWIQGNPLGRKFKALVTHDGTFVADAKISTDELWFMEHDFNGTFWANRDNYRRWDPSAPEHILQFGTPHLIVHSSNDYRLPIAEGLSLFNVLQERGVPSRLLNFPDENHWVTDPENSLVWHQQVLGWLNRYSGLEESNPSAVSLDDTVVPVVNYNP